MTHARVLYEFGDFILDASQRCLLRSDTQVAIPLTGKVFDTLLYLVEHAGDTVEKDELLRSIWPGVIVEENSLTQNISMLRQALGESRGENRYIATIARKGYRFVAKVTPRQELSSVAEGPNSPPPSAAPSPAKAPMRFQPRLVIAGLVLIVATVTAATWFVRTRDNAPVSGFAQTLAILPFKPLLPAERNESLELGMAQSLIASLGEHSPQRISPLSSVRRYTALDQDPVAAGRELGVDMVLDGSLQRRDDRLRVSVQLLRVVDGKQLWARRFDQDFTTIFEVQDAIATSVAKSLSLREIDTGLARTAPTVDPEAYALYASGQFAWSRQSEASLLQSISFYEQALERDAKYALAYSGLADSYALLGVFGIRDPKEVFPMARAAVDKALALDPDLATAHSALGHIKMMYEHDWDGAAREYKLAIELDPSVAVAHQRRALLYAMQGDTDRAIAAANRAQEIEPLWLPPRAAVANFLYYAKRYPESIRLLEQVLALDARQDNARAFLVRNLIATRDYDRALAELDKGPIQMPGAHAHRAQAFAFSGRRKAAAAELDRVLELSKQRYVPAYDIALIYSALGDTQNTFTWLERAMDDRSTLMVFLARDPSFESLHTDPRFAALVKRVGIYGRALPH